ncbi:MAG: ABC transporter ATP-binding protein [Gammaproteobacteria bacterium]
MSGHAIVVEQLRKDFSKVCAVKDVSFCVEYGATCGLLGANGAGKTTTIAMLLGLIEPTAGSIRILGQDMVRDRYRVLPRINFSSPYVDLPQRLTVAQNLTIYARLYGVHPAKKRLQDLAAELELDGLMTRPYRTLSAGQKTRVSLAKALLNHPQVVLLDEPTASLDPDSADRIRAYLSRYQETTAATILLASHNMAEVERLCSDVVIMRAGTIVDCDTPSKLIERYGRKTMEEVFLDIARNHD